MDGSNGILARVSAVSQNRWPKVVLVLAGLLAVSFGMAYLLEAVLSYFEGMLGGLASLAYLTVFVTTLLGNLTVIAPVPVAAAIMVAAASRWDPILVSLFASLGGTLGELSGYYAGYLGKGLLIRDYTNSYDKVAKWMNRHGVWALSFLAFQPVLPFDIAGLVAGSSRMPLWKFMPALWVGKFPKYILLSYIGTGLLHLSHS